MQTTIKSFVNTKDYTTFLIHNTGVWNSFKTRFTEDLEQANNQPKPVKNKFQFIHWFLSNGSEKDYPVVYENNEIIQKLSLVQQRLELIQNEWNRLQYYVTYKHEQIELHPELAESFFSYIAEEIKSSINFH